MPLLNQVYLSQYQASLAANKYMLLKSKMISTFWPKKDSFILSEGKVLSKLFRTHLHQLWSLI